MTRCRLGVTVRPKAGAALVWPNVSWLRSECALAKVGGRCCVWCATHIRLLTILPKILALAASNRTGKCKWPPARTRRASGPAAWLHEVLTTYFAKSSRWPSSLHSAKSSRCEGCTRPRQPEACPLRHHQVRTQRACLGGLCVCGGSLRLQVPGCPRFNGAIEWFV